MLLRKINGSWFRFGSISGLYHLFVQPPLKKRNKHPLSLPNLTNFPRDIANVHGYQECNWPGDKDKYDPGSSVFKRQHVLFSGSLNYTKTRLEDDFTSIFSQNWIDPIYAIDLWNEWFWCQSMWTELFEIWTSHPHDVSYPEPKSSSKTSRRVVHVPHEFVFKKTPRKSHRNDPKTFHSSIASFKKGFLGWNMSWKSSSL